VSPQPPPHGAPRHSRRSYPHAPQVHPARPARVAGTPSPTIEPQPTSSCRDHRSVPPPPHPLRRRAVGDCPKTAHADRRGRAFTSSRPGRGGTEPTHFHRSPGTPPGRRVTKTVPARLVSAGPGPGGRVFARPGRRLAETAPVRGGVCGVRACRVGDCRTGTAARGDGASAAGVCGFQAGVAGRGDGACAGRVCVCRAGVAGRGGLPRVAGTAGGADRSCRKRRSFSAWRRCKPQARCLSCSRRKASRSGQ